MNRRVQGSRNPGRSGRSRDGSGKDTLPSLPDQKEDEQGPKFLSVNPRGESQDASAEKRGEGRQTSEPSGSSLPVLRNVAIVAGVFAALFIGAPMLWKNIGADVMRGVMPALIERRIQNIVPEALAEGDAIQVFFCGTGSPLIDANRANACVGIVTGSYVMVFDAGPRSAINLRRMGFPIHDIDAIFLTHLHSDHFGGLGEMLLQSWVAGAERKEPVTVYGPVGTDGLVAAINASYEEDTGFRIAHHGTDLLVPEAQGATSKEVVAVEGEATDIIGSAGLQSLPHVSVTLVNHEPIHPALAFRVDYLGRSVSISGDTIPSQSFQDFSADVDLMIHEALSKEMLMQFKDALLAIGNTRTAGLVVDVMDYHTTPVEAAEIARGAGAGMLAFTHIVPPLLETALLGPLFVDGVDEVYDGKAIIAEDGMLITISADGSDPKITQIF